MPNIYTPFRYYLKGVITLFCLLIIDFRMSVISATRKYQHDGVFIPYRRPPGDGTQWSSDPQIYNEGFIFIDTLKANKVFCVQSVGTGDILVNKIESEIQYWADRPEELRISTARVGSLCRLPRPRMVGNVERIHFNELLFWQRTVGTVEDPKGGPDKEREYYSTYFR